MRSATLIQKTVIAVFALAMLLAVPAQAARVYRYQDKNGNWHFSDKKPDQAGVETDVVTYDAFADNTLKAELLVREVDGILSLVAVNPFPAPVELAVSIDKQGNKGIRGVLQPDSETVVYQPVESRREVFDHVFVLGDPEARADGSAYRLPAKANGFHKITQGFNGRYSHAAAPNRYAVDIDLPLGTDVLAARSGVVVWIKQDYVLDGTDDYFADKANMIQVLHEDGTIAVYAHLLNESVKVSVGQQVEAGQVLARSGSSGYSTGPHLHFVVWKNTGLQYRSVPFTFMTDSGKSWQPAVGQVLPK